MRQTSIDAYETIKNNGLLSKARMAVYEAVFRHGPATAGELAKAIGAGSRNNIATRLSELRSLGIVKELGTAYCRASGYASIVWMVTDSLPQKNTDRTRPKKTHRALNARNCLHTRGKHMIKELPPIPKDDIKGLIKRFFDAADIIRDGYPTMFYQGPPEDFKEWITFVCDEMNKAEDLLRGYCGKEKPVRIRAQAIRDCIENGSTSK